MVIRTWIWVVAGVLGLCAVGCVALVGTGAYLAMRHMDIRSLPQESAAREFDAVRHKFAGQTPLIEIDAADGDRMRINYPSASAPAQPVRQLHLLVWAKAENTIVRLWLPLWLLRLNPAGFHVTAGDGEFSFERYKLTVDDIERHGPGLLVDHGTAGERVLIWAE